MGHRTGPSWGWRGWGVGSDVCVVMRCDTQLGSVWRVNGVGPTKAQVLLHTTVGASATLTASVVVAPTVAVAAAATAMITTMATKRHCSGPTCPDVRCRVPLPLPPHHNPTPSRSHQRVGCGARKRGGEHTPRPWRWRR